MKPFVHCDAVFSPAHDRRTSLTRIWDRSLPMLPVVMLNPSTAGVIGNDPTTLKVCTLADRAGYGGVTLANVYDIRASDPRKCRDFRGQRLSEAGALKLDFIAHTYHHIVCAWGASPWAQEDAFEVSLALVSHGATLKCWGRNKDGSPRHPLYLASNTPLEDFPLTIKLG